jgi:hypothetical protein
MLIPLAQVVDRDRGGNHEPNLRPDHHTGASRFLPSAPRRWWPLQAQSPDRHAGGGFDGTPAPLAIAQHRAPGEASTIDEQIEHPDRREPSGETRRSSGQRSARERLREHLEGDRSDQRPDAKPKTMDIMRLDG